MPTPVSKPAGIPIDKREQILTDTLIQLLGFECRAPEYCLLVNQSSMGPKELNDLESQRGPGK